jgi:site-specific DNA recombinase
MSQQERAGSYARQSMASLKSISEQAYENREAAHRHGWNLITEYQDGGSASRFARRVRDSWLKVLDDVSAARLDVLILWEPSRGDRDPATWLAFLATCRERKVRIYVTSHDTTYDLRNMRHWRTLAEDGIDAAYESEKVSVRTRRGQAGAVRRGRPAHGPTPLGYRRVYDQKTGLLAAQEKDPDTAPIVVEIITRVAKGDPVSTITNDLNARGVPSGRAAAWYRARVREVASNPAYGGLRRHNEERTPGQWEPLVDPQIFHAAQRVLSAPHRKTTRPGRQVHLLSYLATAPCGSPLSVSRRTYRCTGRDSCVTILKEPTDNLVTGLIVDRLSRPGLYESVKLVEGDADQEMKAAQQLAAKLRADLDGWRDSAARGETSPASLAKIEASLVAQIREAEQSARAATPTLSALDLLAPGDDTRSRWEATSQPARRDIIRLLAEIVVAPAISPAPRVFEPGRLRLSRWVGDDRTWGEIA